MCRTVPCADILVIEATFLERDILIAGDYGDLTGAQAAELAAASGVKSLVLTHISGRSPTTRFWRRQRKHFQAAGSRQISTAS
jgi:ribonuclease BN (tRNA processing enzyme)